MKSEIIAISSDVPMTSEKSLVEIVSSKNKRVGMAYP